MRLTTKKVVYSFSGGHQPVLRVACKEAVEIETLDCFSNQLRKPEDILKELDWDRINPATGPIYVEGAEPGDTLKVTINNILLDNKGIVVCGEGDGVLGHLLKGKHIHVVPIEDGIAKYAPNIEIPVKPMIGVIGVAPLGQEVKTGIPGRHGGNMDNKMVAHGAILYFPVSVPGALFALGDIHGVMGDGEIGISGLEIPGIANVTFEVIKNKSWEYPFLENDESVSVIVSKLSLDEAVNRAAQLMLEFLETKSSLSRPDLIMLMSLVGNAEICQVVDPLKTVRFVMPKEFLPKITF